MKAPLSLAMTAARKGIAFHPVLIALHLSFLRVRASIDKNVIFLKMLEKSYHHNECVLTPQNTLNTKIYI